MFCNELIINVYKGDTETLETNAFFDCYHNNSISLHLTKGYRIVLETEHYYISLGFNGVKLDKKRCVIDDYAESGEWFDTFVHDIEDSNPWIEYEHTLFFGEHLIDVQTDGSKYIAVFDDFSINIIPHLSDDEISGIYNEHYLHVFGCERLITRKCNCGGTGELLLDFVSDYIVRCNKCHVSTWAECLAIDAIDSWNKAETGCDLSEITIE